MPDTIFTDHPSRKRKAYLHEQHAVSYNTSRLFMPTSENRVLLTTQKNVLFLALEAEGLSPSDFTLSEHPGKNTAYIRHRFTTYQFSITVVVDSSRDETYFVTRASPGWELPQEEHNCRDWNSVTSRFAYWTTCLNTQLQAPDLWSTVSGDSQLIKLAADQDNRPFTPDDQLQFKKALDEIQAYLIKSHNLTGARFETVESRLSYLEEAATRMGRKDVIHIAIGVLANIATGLALDANSTRELFQFAGQIFKQLLGTMLYLVGPH